MPDITTRPPTRRTGSHLDRTGQAIRFALRLPLTDRTIAAYTIDILTGEPTGTFDRHLADVLAGRDPDLLDWEAKGRIAEDVLRRLYPNYPALTLDGGDAA